MNLTPREREVLQLVAAGLTLAEAAKEVNYSTQTIKDDSKHLREKLQARSLTHAVVIALRDGEIVFPSTAVTVSAASFPGTQVS